MQPVSMAFQHLARLPSLALQRMSVIGQGLKNRVADIWKSFEKTKLWQISIKPLYDRYIEPLGKFEALLLLGSLASAIVISYLAVQLFSMAALPLGVAIGAALVGIAYSLTRRRVEYYLEKKAYQEVEKIRVAVNNITHTNRKYDAVQQARELLRKDKFEHLSKDWEELDRQLGYFKKIVLNDNPNRMENNLEETKKTVKVYLESLLRKLDPYQAVNPLPGFVQASGNPL